MSFKFNKRILLIMAVLMILTLIPISFANDLDNTTISADDNEVLTADDTIYVSNGDEPGTGTSDNPYNSISTAVDKYNSSTNSKIYIKNGEYSISSQIKLNKDLTIVGESKEGTVLNGNSQNSIFEISDHAQVTLINLTFKNAKSSAITLDSYTRSNVLIDNCIFNNNTGSAVYYKASFTNVNTAIEIKDSIFKNNYNNDGGAIYIYGGSLLNITNSIFENNRCPTGESDVSDGGAIYGAGNVKNIYIDYCTFINNTATRGSTISQYCGGNLYISYSRFINNTSPGNSKYKANSSLIYDEQSNNNELTIYLNNNVIENNLLNDEIVTKGNVKVVYLDKNTRITANDVDKIYGDDYNYEVVLTEINGNPLANKQITVTLTNKYNNEITVLSNLTDANGKAIISLKTQKAGKYSAVAKFEAEGELDSVNITNNINIKTENQYNLVFDPDYIYMTEGDSCIVNGTIYDEYMVPTNDLNGQSIAIEWYDNFGKNLYLDIKSEKVNGSKLKYDINRCHLVTSNVPYKLNFDISGVTASVIVDLSKDFSNIDETLDTFYVSKNNGNDTTGDGSASKPLATIQTALSANYYFGGGKTIKVDEGVYEISTFTVLGNVTVIGVKSKTILKQTAGVLGMLEIDSGNTVGLINLTFIDGYATPEPESLIHVADDSIVYIDNCEFENNTAIDGGALSISTGGSAYVTNSYFHNNKALLSRIGGAIYVDRGYLYLADSIFENNTAGEGGAIFLGFPSEAFIINSTFVNNTASNSNIAASGGAIFTRSSNLVIENSSFIENSAEYGGAIYIDYGAIYVYKSYFENNRVTLGSATKGSAINGAVTSYCNITMQYSILISEDDTNYLVYIPNLDENYTAETNYNLWKTNGQTSNTGVSNQVKIIISTDSEFIYTGDVVEFTVEFVNSNVNGTSKLNASVHDFDVLLISKIGNIIDKEVTIKNNKAIFAYEATTVGEETISAGNMFKFADYKFDVQDGSDKIKINSSFNIETGKKTKIIVTFDANIDNNVTIRVNDESYSVKVNDSKAILELNTLPGTYTVKVVYPGDSTYKGFVESQTFEVAKFSSVLTADNITTYYNGNFNVTLRDDEGKAIPNEKIIIRINGTEYSATTDANGVASLELNLKAIGKYDVTSIFTGNSNFNSSQANSTLTVEFAKIKLTADENVKITPIKGSFSFKLTDNNDKPLKNTEVVITFNKKSVTVITDENGMATIDLNNNSLSIGSYDISAKVNASAVYSEAILNSSLTVIKATATITAENITVYANNGELIINLVDENGNGINNTNITVKIGNDLKTVTTNEEGTATLKLQLTPGNYTAIINIAENPVYDAMTVNSKITVNENIVLINAPAITVYYSNGKFKVYVTDVNNNSIADVKLTITIGNDDQVTLTDENGTATINVNRPIGTYNVYIKFDGNTLFKPANATSVINVVSSILADDLIRSYNSPYDFRAVLKDENGNPVSNQSIVLMVNGKEYNVKTDANGILLFHQTLAVGTYAITITNPITGEKTANYAQILPRLMDNKNIVAYYGANPVYKVRAFDDDGNPVGAGEIVTVNFNGKNYQLKTDKNGYVSFKITSKAKTYTITSTYKGYKVSNKIVIKPVLTAKNVSKKKAKKIIFRAKLVNTKGKPLKGKKITFKIKGKKYKAKTNKKGVAKITLKNLKVGKYKITTKYGKNTIKNTIKIKK